MKNGHEKLMRAALREGTRAGSEGNDAVGALLCDGDKIVARGRNLVRSTWDVTAHAETVALRIATEKLRLLDLAGFTLYTTFEPCPMCCGAALNSGVTSIIIGASGSGRWGDYSVSRLLLLVGKSEKVHVETGVLAEECLNLLARWRGTTPKSPELDRS